MKTTKSTKGNEKDNDEESPPNREAAKLLEKFGTSTKGKGGDAASIFMHTMKMYLEKFEKRLDAVEAKLEKSHSIQNLQNLDKKLNSCHSALPPILTRLDTVEKYYEKAREVLEKFDQTKIGLINAEARLSWLERADSAAQKVLGSGIVLHKKIEDLEEKFDQQIKQLEDQIMEMDVSVIWKETKQAVEKMTVESRASDAQMEANFSKLATHVSTSSSEWECRWQALKSKVETMEMDAESLKHDFGDLIQSNFKMMHIIAAHPQRSAARERDFKDPHLSF